MSINPALPNNYFYKWWEINQGLTNQTARLVKTICRSWPFSHTLLGGYFAGAAEVVEHFTELRIKPDWCINSTEVDGRCVEVSVEIVLEKPFCRLLHFSKSGVERRQRRLLIIAPMSGHYATLLRGTVEAFLPDHDVYITDWINARDVPLAEGPFDLHAFIDYEIEFMDTLNQDGGLHVKAVCQPCPTTLAAVAVMVARDDADHPPPRSVIFSAGPVDTRANPTEVTKYAEKHSLSDFERLAIHEVPPGYAGAGRKVYPGALQLASFLGMNPGEHGNKMFKQFLNLTRGDKDSADAHRRFYDEYLAVCDLPSEFYLQTIHHIFHEQSIARGDFEHHGKQVDITKITETAFMVTEGGKDDISAPGQAFAAIELASGLSEDKKYHLLMPGVGHYGVFNGKVFRKQIMPREAAFMASVDACGHAPRPAVVQIASRRRNVARVN